MAEPVIAKDGHIYEKSAIQNWLKIQSISPNTRQLMKAKFIDNIGKRGEVYTFVTQHRQEYEAALFKSVQDNHLEDVTYLLKLGVSPNCKDSKGYTPFQYACQLNHKEIMVYLLSSGVNSTHEIEPPAELHQPVNISQQFLKRLTENQNQFQNTINISLQPLQAAIRANRTLSNEKAALIKNMQEDLQQANNHLSQAVNEHANLNKDMAYFENCSAIQKYYALPCYSSCDPKMCWDCVSARNRAQEKVFSGRKVIEGYTASLKSKICSFNSIIDALYAKYQLSNLGVEPLMWDQATYYAYSKAISDYEYCRKIDPYASNINYQVPQYKGLIENSAWRNKFDDRLKEINEVVNQCNTNFQSLNALTICYENCAQRNAELVAQIKSCYTALQQKIQQSINQGITQFNHVNAQLQQIYQIEQLLFQKQQLFQDFFKQGDMQFDDKADMLSQAKKADDLMLKLKEWESIWDDLKQKLEALGKLIYAQPTALKCQIIHLTAHAGQMEVLESLLKNGMLIDSPDTQGQTPLTYAIKGRQTETVKLLLQYGANPYLKDTKGNTLLHIAAQFNAIESAKLVLECGISYKEINYAGQTAAQVAIQQGNIELAMLLQVSGSQYAQQQAAKQRQQNIDLQKQVDALQQQLNLVLAKLGIHSEQTPIAPATPAAPEDAAKPPHPAQYAPTLFMGTNTNPLQQASDNSEKKENNKPVTPAV